MMQYIDKDVLISEIKRRRSKNAKNKLNLVAALEDNYLFSFLNTLEVKDVDLGKEFDNYIKEKNIIACDVQFEPFTHLYNCAKYFYELGLIQKGK